MDRGKKSSRGLSPQSPSRSRPANISAEQSRGQAGSRLASVSPPHTTIRVICLIFQKWRQNCCGSHDRLPATGPGPENTACTFTDRPMYIHILTDLTIFSPFLPAQCQDCQEGRATGWVAVVVVCLKVAVPG